MSNEKILDANGLTEEEFLQKYDRTQYDRPAFTVDNLLFADCGDGLAVLMIKRGSHPDLGQWALPGGFVKPNECAECAASRELKEETGIEVATEQLITVSTPMRDPRGWTVSTCFLGLLPEPAQPEAGDDATEARWFNVDYIASGDVYKLILKSDDITIASEFKVVRNEAGKIDLNRTEILAPDGIAFDHAKIILYAVESL
ncbi:MAG: NUDIX hydrolase [Clostridia bacterium]|jgi:8-oxo-dGTP diphosphatase|uniref:NUDIX domain-containing protein n=1 Tax=Pumilibacter muris TaxID=2941510 RepID=UPI0020420DC7|nr:NUDIX hydrolase [Pumilibacter muris]MCI8596502.1 NUDIX hydrolase [Clostridia bacterium]